MAGETRTRLLRAVQRTFLEFLQEFRSEGIHGPCRTYVEKAKKMLLDGSRTLCVNFSDLEKVAPHGAKYKPEDLRRAVETRFLIVRPALNAALHELMVNLREGINVQAEVASDYEVTFCELPTPLSVRALRVESLGKLVAVTGVIAQTSDILPELRVGVFACKRCGKEVEHAGVEMSGSCPGCSRVDVGWTFLWGTQFGNWQKVQLREDGEAGAEGSSSRSLDVVVSGDSCDSFRIGDHVVISGCLVAAPEKGVANIGCPANHRFTLLASVIRSSRGAGDSAYAENASRTPAISQPHVISANLRSVKSLSKLALEIAPMVHGNLEAKKAILLMLIGGVAKKARHGIKSHNNVHVCLLGHLATAKSSLLRWTASLLPRGVYVSGPSSSAAGLTVSVNKDHDGQGVTFQPGALMVASGGVCCIDDLDLMAEADQASIHEAMSHQTITLAKAGAHTQLNASASVLAACSMEAATVGVQAPTIARCLPWFDLVLATDDASGDAADIDIAQHILGITQQSLVPSQSSQDASATLRRHVAAARQVDPSLTQDAQARLVCCYGEMRQRWKHTTPKHLESLIKLSEAVARARLDVDITVEHVDEAIELVGSTLGLKVLGSRIHASSMPQKRARRSGA